MNETLERICAELSAEADAKWPPKPKPPEPEPRREMSEASFKWLMAYFGLDRGQIITIAGDPEA